MKYLLSKLCSCLGATRRIRSFLNQKSLLTLYHSFFNSHLQYCITNWCYSNKTLVNKLQQLCNKFIRVTFGLKRNYDVNDIMSKYKILNINQMLFKEINVLMFKENIGKNPIVFFVVADLKVDPNLILKPNIRRVARTPKSIKLCFDFLILFNQSFDKC